MAALIVFGAICFGRLGVSQLPDVQFPVLTVSAKFPGAAPEIMESDVIDPIEDAVMSLQGVKSVSSTGRNGIATIMIEFTIDRNVDLALQDLQGKISQIESQLPKNLEPLVITKNNPDEFPILWLSVTNSSVSTQELMTYVRDNIRDKLASVPGVGSLWTPGFLQPNLRVWVNPKKLDSAALTVQDVVSTLQNEHQEPPGGRVELRGKDFNLRTLGEAKTVSQFEQIQVTSRGGAPNYNPIHLGQVARIEDGTEDIIQFARSNGKAAVGVGVVKQRGANAVDVARAVKKRIIEIEKNAPPGVKLFVNFDSTLFIEEAIGELTLTLVLAAVLTSLVCWLFLGSWTSTLNVILAIPTSIVGSFIILYALGFTLNMFTLLGLSLAIGIVVDDAIMVLENIIRHREMGKSKRDAASIGAREITFAAIAATISIIAIFLPIALVQGIIGKFLFQFGVTMTAAVSLSLVEALTLTPMRASKFVEVGERTTKLGKGFEALMHALGVFYVKTLQISLAHRWKVLLLSVVLFIVSFASVGLLNKEFQPPQDQGSLMVKITNPVGSALSLTDEKLKLVEDFLLSRSEVDTTFAAAGGWTGGELNTAWIFVSLKHKGHRGIDPVAKKELSQQELIPIVRDHLLKLVPDARPVVQDPSQQGYSQGSGFPVEFTIQGPDWDRLADYAKQVMGEMKKTGLMTDVDFDYEAGAPEVQIVPDRIKAAQHGVSIASIGQTVTAAMGGVIAGKYSKGSHRYDIRVKAFEEARPTAERIRELKVRNNRGERVSLGSVVDVEHRPAASAISRKNRQRAITITAGVVAGKSMQDALDQSRKIAQKILPAGEGYRLMESGSTEEFKESVNGMVFALGMGLVVAYMVLASQFNSFIDPITVFMALPFSFSGAFLGLLAGRQSLNIFSMIGLILLMGIVKKNSILLVDFTNHVREQEKLGVKEALMKACPIRLRPILMTSIATVAGAIPGALAFGPGAESRAPMSYAVIGGVLLSTLLTLYVVPVVYSFLSRLGRSHESVV